MGNERQLVPEKFATDPDPSGPDTGSGQRIRIGVSRATCRLLTLSVISTRSR